MTTADDDWAASKGKAMAKDLERRPKGMWAHSDKLIAVALREAFTAGREDALAWTVDDQVLPEDAAIQAAHPLRTGRHDLYAEAMRLVGAKRSKGGLVALVNWLVWLLWSRGLWYRDLTKKPVTAELDPTGVVDTFRRHLLAVWHQGHSGARGADDAPLERLQRLPEFVHFSGHTKDLLLALGMEWDHETQDYTFIREPFEASPPRPAKDLCFKETIVQGSFDCSSTFQGIDTGESGNPVMLVDLIPPAGLPNGGMPMTGTADPEVGKGTWRITVEFTPANADHCRAWRRHGQGTDKYDCAVCGANPGEPCVRVEAP